MEMPVFKYNVPLEGTGDGYDPAYDYPEGDEHSQYSENDHLVVNREKSVPFFHKDAVSVEV